MNKNGYCSYSKNVRSRKKYTNNTEKDGVQIKFTGPVMKAIMLGDNYGDFEEVKVCELNVGHPTHGEIDSRVFLIRGVSLGLAQEFKVFTGPELTRLLALSIPEFRMTRNISL